jgi:uncharacterized protein (DUF362 family)
MIPNNRVYVHLDRNLDYYPSVSVNRTNADSKSGGYASYPAGNAIYEAVRACFIGLGLDATNTGSPRWNPLGEFIQPGMRVLVKPNMVMHTNRGGGGLDCLVTHPSIIRVMCAYAVKALGGNGTLIIADAPIQSADFNRLRSLMGIDGIARQYADRFPGLRVEVRDFRTPPNSCEVASDDVTEFDIGDRSELEGAGGRRFRCADYPTSRMALCHGQGTHKYYVPSVVLDSDVVLNLPKLKTHAYAGMTAALKNFIGVCATKDNLPHFSRGSLAEGGDEYLTPDLRCQLRGDLADDFADRKMTPGVAWASVPRLAVFGALMRIARASGCSKNGRGEAPFNDTIWRTILDVYRIARTGLPGGKLGLTHRTIFTMVDAVVAGEGNGPLRPDPAPLGLLLAGTDPYAVDLVAAHIGGFNIEQLRYLTSFPSDLTTVTPDSVRVCSNQSRWDGRPILDCCSNISLRPANGWSQPHRQTAAAKEIPSNACSDSQNALR